MSGHSLSATLVPSTATKFSSVTAVADLKMLPFVEYSVFSESLFYFCNCAALLASGYVLTTVCPNGWSLRLKNMGKNVLRPGMIGLFENYSWIG